MPSRAAAPDNLTPVGAFVPGGRVRGRAGAPAARSPGLTFAVKDLIDIAGPLTGGGNPDWLATHRAPARSHPSWRRSSPHGATLRGQDHHRRTRLQPRGRQRPLRHAAQSRCAGPPAGRLVERIGRRGGGRPVDFALGTDTGGSVRVPAAFCGLFRFPPERTAACPMDGVIPFAPSYDMVGWMARDAETLWRVGQVLTGPQQAAAARVAGFSPAMRFALADAELRPRCGRRQRNGGPATDRSLRRGSGRHASNATVSSRARRSGVRSAPGSGRPLRASATPSGRASRTPPP